MGRLTRVALVLVALVGGGAGYYGGSGHLLTPQRAIAAEECQTFPETGKQVCGRFLEYWRANGGLAQQGLPLSDPFDERSDVNGQTYTVQYFERARFEYHPEHAETPFEVRLGLLGREQFLAKYPTGAPAGTGGGRCFAENGQCTDDRFFAYWQSHGGLAQQGLPLSDPFDERSNVNGQTYTVQYFERARFEYHPEHAGTAYEVLLGLLGREQIADPAPAPMPQPTPRPRATPQPTPEPELAPMPQPTPRPRATPQPTPEPELAPMPQPTPRPRATPQPTPEPELAPMPQPTPRPRATPQPTPESALDVEESAFLQRINAYRAEHGLRPLGVAAPLTAAADWLSRDMAAKGYFSHTDSLGRDPFQRMCAFGYCQETYKGENIAAGHAGADATFLQWKNSPGHNENMLNPNFTMIGIGRAPGGTYGWYWTTTFGGQ